MIVYGSSVASGTIVSGGFLYLLESFASGTVVSAGGREELDYGALARGTRVSSGGTQLLFHGLASGTVVSSGGFQHVQTFAYTSGTVVSSGGIERVEGGGAYYTIVSAGGSEVVVLGGEGYGKVAGYSFRTTVMTGGSETVLSGGAASGTTISGGLLEVMEAGSADATEFAGGGTLQLDDSVHFAGTVAGFAEPDQLDLRDIAFGAGTTVSFTQDVGSGTLAVSDGAHTANITLIGSYTTAQFHLADDGYGLTLVTDPPVSSGGASAPFSFADLAPSAPSEKDLQPSPAGMPQTGYGSMLALPSDLGATAFALLHNGLPPPA